MNTPTFWHLNWEKLKSSSAAGICNQQRNTGEADGLKRSYKNTGIGAYVSTPDQGT